MHIIGIEFADGHSFYTGVGFYSHGQELILGNLIYPIQGQVDFVE
jgi:hypothetical protein